MQNVLSDFRGRGSWWFGISRIYSIRLEYGRSCFVHQKLKVRQDILHGTYILGKNVLNVLSDFRGRGSWWFGISRIYSIRLEYGRSCFVHQKLNGTWRKSNFRMLEPGEN